jgi:uncharacterized protein (TIGR03067 family)
MWRAALVLLAAVVAGVAVAAPAPSAAPNRRDLKALQGTWLLYSMTWDGLSAPMTARRQRTTWTFAGTTWAEAEDGKVTLTATVKLSAASKPPSMDLVAIPGGETGQFIYKVEGDALTICGCSPGVPRPKEFLSKRGSFTLLMVFKRAKKLPAHPD